MAIFLSALSSLFSKFIMILCTLSWFLDYLSHTVSQLNTSTSTVYSYGSGVVMGTGGLGSWIGFNYWILSTGLLRIAELCIDFIIIEFVGVFCIKLEEAIDAILDSPLLTT
jgi:hypothetical protein